MITVSNTVFRQTFHTSSNYNFIISCQADGGQLYSLITFTAFLTSLPVLQIQCLQQSLEEVKSRYSIQLNQLQVTISTLEMEMQQLKLSIEKQQTEYNHLLDIKMRLELEITEYRRLLDGERK